MRTAQTRGTVFLYHLDNPAFLYTTSFYLCWKSLNLMRQAQYQVLEVALKSEQLCNCINAFMVWYGFAFLHNRSRWSCPAKDRPYWLLHDETSTCGGWWCTILHVQVKLNGQLDVNLWLRSTLYKSWKWEEDDCFIVIWFYHDAHVLQFLSIWKYLFFIVSLFPFCSSTKDSSMFYHTKQLRVACKDFCFPPLLPARTWSRQTTVYYSYQPQGRVTSDLLWFSTRAPPPSARAAAAPPPRQSALRTSCKQLHY